MRLLLTFVALTASLPLATAAPTRPMYAEKEKKVCAFCHVDPKGGGPRNPRGLFYESHGLSFAGFQDSVKKSGLPGFKKSWQIYLPKEARRISIADVNADKKPRLLVLGKGGELTVYRTAAMGLTKEQTVDLGPSAGRFVAGKFAKDKPAVIAVPGSIYYLEGDGFKSKKVELAEITGSVKFADGSEYIFFFAGGQPDVYGIDLAASNPLTPGRDMVLPAEAAGVYRTLVAHLPAELLGALGVPEDAHSAGVVGLIDPRSDDKLYGFWARQTKDGSFLDLLDASNLPPEHAGAV